MLDAGQDELRARKREYHRLRRSRLAHEVLPKMFGQIDKETLTLSELSDLVEQETSIRFQGHTLRKLLLDRYSGAPSGPPIAECTDSPGRYRLRQAFYS